MAKKRNSKKQKTYQKSRARTRDPLRSFLGLDVPHYRLNEIRGQPYSPYEKPKARKERIMGRLVEPNNQTIPTIQNKPVNLFQALKTVKLPMDRNICVQRQQRKEVIHALNHAGKSGQKKQVRTATSNIHCKG